MSKIETGPGTFDNQLFQGQLKSISDRDWTSGL